MADRIRVAADVLADLAVRAVVALPLFVLHHAALLVELRLVDDAEQMAHAIGLHPQREIERTGLHVLEVVRAIEPRGAVDLGRARGLQRAEIFVVVMLRAVEHQVLEEMRKARAARALVLAAHVVVRVHRDDRRLVVFVHDQRQAIGQHEALERDVDVREARGGRRRRPPRGLGGPRRGGKDERRGDSRDERDDPVHPEPLLE
jgi:hypothetical protein